jgi:hypothetical protein
LFSVLVAPIPYFALRKAAACGTLINSAPDIAPSLISLYNKRARQPSFLKTTSHKFHLMQAFLWPSLSIYCYLAYQYIVTIEDSLVLLVSRLSLITSDDK